MYNIKDILKANTYPGRGIIFGVGQNAHSGFIAYFIMGRSQNSRNRVFAKEDGGGIKTMAADAKKLDDPSLIIYSPVKKHEKLSIVTNGTQTNTILQHIKNGQSFESALRTHSFEPDPPHYTPRISGVFFADNAGFNYKLSILKTVDEAKSLQRSFWEYPSPQNGQGHFLHTYEKNCDILPSFSKEPLPVLIEEPFEDFANSIWENLDDDNKISLFAQKIFADGTDKTLIYNKYSKL